MVISISLAHLFLAGSVLLIVFSFLCCGFALFRDCPDFPFSLNHDLDIRFPSAISLCEGLRFAREIVVNYHGLQIVM